MQTLIVATPSDWVEATTSCINHKLIDIRRKLHLAPGLRKVSSFELVMEDHGKTFQEQLKCKTEGHDRLRACQVSPQKMKAGEREQDRRCSRLSLLGRMKATKRLD